MIYHEPTFREMMSQHWVAVAGILVFFLCFVLMLYAIGKG